MKKTCNNCKALRKDPPAYSCQLGLKIKVLRGKDFLVAKIQPEEECPKPKTNKDFVNISLNRYIAGE